MRVFVASGLCMAYLSASNIDAFLLSSTSGGRNHGWQVKKNLQIRSKQFDDKRSQILGSHNKQVNFPTNEKNNKEEIEWKKEFSPLSSFFPRFSTTLLPLSFCLSLLISVFTIFSPIAVSADENSGAGETGQSFKIKKGAASTLNQGIVKTITRGVTLDGSDFSNSDLSGVSFQQSLIRNGKFQGTKLRAASFFDADLTGADFTGADMNQCNLELANLKDAILRDAIITEAYISGATRLTNIDITGADFTDTLLRGDQQKALCKKASGVNSITGVATADSLLCN